MLSFTIISHPFWTNLRFHEFSKHFNHSSWFQIFEDSWKGRFVQNEVSCRRLVRPRFLTKKRHQNRGFRALDAMIFCNKFCKMITKHGMRCVCPIDWCSGRLCATFWKRSLDGLWLNLILFGRQNKRLGVFSMHFHRRPFVWPSKIFVWDSRRQLTSFLVRISISDIYPEI